MSRIGREPIPVPQGVKINIDGQVVTVEGKLGALRRTFHPSVAVNLEDNLIKVNRFNDETESKSLHGLSRALLANMVKGVTEGFKKDLEVVGIGYRVEQRGPTLQLSVGFSHRIIFFPPEGITIKVTSQTAFTVSGIDNELVGETAAKIRALRPPEPYKGKGIKYTNETIRRKAGKLAGR